MTIGVQDRLRDSARAALIHVGLQQAAQQFAAFGLEQFFQLTMGHALCLRRAQLGDDRIELLVSHQVGISPLRLASRSVGRHHGVTSMERYGDQTLISTTESPR